MAVTYKGPKHANWRLPVCGFWGSADHVQVTPGSITYRLQTSSFLLLGGATKRVSLRADVFRALLTVSLDAILFVPVSPSF